MANKIAEAISNYIEDTKQAILAIKGRQWIKVICDDLIRFAIIFLLVISFQIHLDSAEYAAQCEYALKQNQFNSNGIMVQLTNESKPSLNFSLNPLKILRTGKSMLSICAS